MATGKTKTALIRHMAEKLQITNKQAAAGLELLAETAIKETKKMASFVIPGIGRPGKGRAQGPHGPQPADRPGHPRFKAKTVSNSAWPSPPRT